MYAADLTDQLTTDSILDCEAIHKLLNHPAKTFIGWIKTEFDFLGLSLSLEQLKLSKTTIETHQAKVFQLAESRAIKRRLEQYWQKWVRWTMGSLHNLVVRLLTRPRLERAAVLHD